jgi:hypothetical protein
MVWLDMYSCIPSFLCADGENARSSAISSAAVKYSLSYDIKETDVLPIRFTGHRVDYIGKGKNAAYAELHSFPRFLLTLPVLLTIITVNGQYFPLEMIE